MLEILKLNLGEFMFRNRYPIKKTVYINNNNDEENELNQKEQSMRAQGERDILFFNNSLITSSFLHIFTLIMRNLFGYLYIYGWLTLIVLLFVEEYILVSLPDQYGHDKAALVVLLLLAIILQTVADWMGFRKRRQWSENK